MQHLKLKYIAGAVMALALGHSLIGCSDDDPGSTVNPGGNGKGGSQASGGSSSAGSSAGGSSSGSGGSGTSGSGSKATGGTANAQACPGVPIDEPAGGSGGSGGTSGDGGDGGENPASGGTGTSGSAGKGGSGGETACRGLSLEAESIDVDMYIMMDRSVSLNTMVAGTGMTRWEALRAAMEAFVSHPDAADIGAGIGFFGRSGHADPNQDCSIDSYSTPDVPVGLISDVGDDIMAAMDDIEPSGLTPTLPAVQGAIRYAVQNAQARPGRAPLVVLVSDGYPTQCQEPVSVSEIAAATQAGYEGTPSVRTYVVGLEAGFNLQSIAQSGGTRAPFLVDETDITNSFVQTMLNITDTKLACNYEVPEAPDPDMQIDFDKVSIIYTPSTGPREEVPRITNLGDCGSSANGGWYYDNPSNPTRILVCPCTCARFQAGRVDVRLGCEPIIGIR